jgi:ferric-dicitrate binding protein FerR (iron transport regulator)
MRGSKLVFLALVALAAPAAAQEDYRHGRIRYLEPGVTLQRGTETGAEEAVVNLPYLPGDRVWTDANGRAEFQFEGGALVRLDSRSKLDYAAHEEGREGRVVLRLWSGGLYLRVRTR